MEDVNFDGFDELVKYLYGNEIGICETNVVELLDLANKYLIEDMLPKLSTFMAEISRVDNAIVFLGLAITYDLTELKDKCDKIISEKTTEVFNTKGFLCCNINVLEAILRLERISCSEACMFDASIDWAKRKCRDERVETSAQNVLK